MSLPRFGVTRPVPVNLLMMAILLAGAFCALSLRRQFFPDIDLDQATVTLPYPGATPAEIEQTLALKVEDKLADLDEVDELTTTITEGGGGIVVKFREGTVDIDGAIDEVERAVESLTDLPDESERIQVTQLEPRMPVIMLALYGDADEDTMKRAIREVRDELRLLPGMGEVLISGVRDYEIHVDIDDEALRAHRLSLPMVSDAISNWMADVPGGSVRSSSGNVNVRTLGVEERAEAIREIVVKGTSDGQALRVRDLAEVSESFVDEQLITRFNGKPSATITIIRVGDQDLVQMAEMARAYVDGRNGAPFKAKANDRLFELMNQGGSTDPNGQPALRTARRQAYDLGANSTMPLPPRTELASYTDLARFVEGRIELLTENALYGAILVFATLLLFLNWRVAFWVGVGLTTALAGTLVLMYAMDISLNLLTMFGLIVVLGLLVDDAIVVAENIQARHDRNEPSLVAAIRGAEEVAWPVVATVLTSIVAFLPLTFVRGQIGDLLGALPAVVAVALVMSLLESLLILPSHMGHSLQHRDKAASVGSSTGILTRFERWRDHVIMDAIVPAYARLLSLALRFRYVTICIALMTLIMTMGIVAGGRLAFTFLPKSDAESVVIDIRMPVGTSINVTDDVVRRIESAVQAQPEIKTISTIIGQRSNLDTGATEVFSTHVAQLFVELLAVEIRDAESMRPSNEVISAIRETLAGNIDEVERISYEEITGGPSGADISIRIRGNDEAELLAVGDEIKDELVKYEGVFDVFDDNTYGQREIQIRLKPGAAAVGLSVSDVARQVRGALYGLDAHVFSDRQEDIDVRVRLDRETRTDLAAIETLWLVGPGGDLIPLGEIAELIDGSSYATIRRVDRKRAVTVTAATAPNVNKESIVAQLPLADIAARHPSVDISFAGQQKQMADAFASLPIGFLAAMIMIYVILAWLFASYTQPLGVMLGIPFGLIGVVWGHVLLGYEMTFLSLIGFVALSGIVVNDSLILVDFFNRKRLEGMTHREALVDAGRQRLRPIFLTTITTVLGLTPLMLETSFQAKFLIPMAIAIAFGLMSATVLILVVLPCILTVIDDVKRASYFLWNGLPRPERTPIPAPVDALAE